MIQFRVENRGEEADVRSLVEDAFGELVVGELVDRLRASPDWIDGLSFVAEQDSRLIGSSTVLRSVPRDSDNIQAGVTRAKMHGTILCTPDRQL